MQDLRWPTYVPRGVVLDGAVFEGTPAGYGALRVRDTEGNVYLDAVGGIGCVPLGHAHPGWVAAIEAQLAKLVASAGTFWTEPQQHAAREITARAGVPDGRVFFGNTGTEVTEAAIKLALRSTGRDVIIAFERAFHGRTLGSIALTANPAYRASYVSVLGEEHEWFGRMKVGRAPYGDLAAVQALLEEHRDRVAMIVVEPIQGEGGIHPGAREFLAGLRELSRRHGALLGVDEIQSGSGRTGSFAAWTTIVGDDPELAPDVAWFAKALGGGLPVAACVARHGLAEHMTKGSHGSTFGGNPLACAAVAATWRIMDEQGLLARAAAQLPTLRRIAEREPLAGVKGVRGLGAMIGIELGDAALAGRVAAGMQAEGVLVTQSGQTAIRWLLPYHAAEAELAQAWGALGRALEKAA